MAFRLAAQWDSHFWLSTGGNIAGEDLGSAQRALTVGFGLRLQISTNRRYTLPVSIREFLLENLAGDLEYHPRRAACLFWTAAV